MSPVLPLWNSRSSRRSRIAGKFIVKLGEFEDYDCGDGSGTGVVDLGNTAVAVTLIK